MIRPKQQFNFTQLCFLLASVICIPLAAPLRAAAQDTAEPSGNTVWTSTLANPNPNGFDTPQIMQALYNPHQDLVLLSAHRGIHALAGLNQASGVSENSLQSIGLAAQQGWEMIELDVKLTSDGVPILSHDKTWGREWCGLSTVLSSVPPRRYDPFTPPGNSTNDSVNPMIANTKLSDTRSLLGETYLRDSVSLLNTWTDHGCSGFNKIFGEYPPTLSDAFDYITKNKIRMAVMLDIQSTAIAQAALNIVLSKVDDAGRPFLNSVVFKMPATVFPGGYTSFLNTFGANATKVNFIPVINTADIAPTTTTITDTEDGGFDLSDVGANGFGGEQGIINWLTNMETSNQFGPLKIPAVEVGMKEPNGILTSVLSAAKLNLGTKAAMTVGEFNPVGEYYASGDQTPQFFRSSNGSCCDKLDQYLYNNPNNTGPKDPSQPVDHSDQRTNLNFLLSQGFQYLITDNPIAAHSLLIQLGQRNICYLEPTPGQNCNIGGLSACEAGDGACTSSGDGGSAAGTAGSDGNGPCVYGNGACVAPDPAGCTADMLCVGRDPAIPPNNLIATNAPVPGQRIAYYNSWSVYGNAFYPKALDTKGIAGRLTSLIYSFENIDPVNLTCFAANQPVGTDPNNPNNYDGGSDAYADYQMGFTSDNSVDGSTDQWGQPLEGNFNQLRELKVRYPNLKVLISIGGWTYSKFFSDVAATDTTRKKFVSSCINLYIKGNLPVLSTSPAGGTGAAAGIFDGFDIDWEFPASPDGNIGNHYSAQDTANYTALFAEFRAQLNALGGKQYMLTAAVPAGPTEINSLQISQLAQYLDYADLLSYDFHGAFETNGPTNLQAPLFDAPASPAFGTGFTVDSAITSWINKGFPANKLNLGVAFYGRGWTGVPDAGSHGLYRSVNGATAPFSLSQQAGVVDYKELEAAGILSSNNLFFDQTTDTSWVYDGENFYGIDIPFSLQYKRAYIKQKGLAGVMMYSLEDDDSSNSLFNAAIGSSQ